MYRMRITEPGQPVSEMRLPAFEDEDAVALATEYLQADERIERVDVIREGRFVASITSRQ